MLARATDLLDRLRALEIADRIGAADPALLRQWGASGVRFAASTARMEEQYWRAVQELMACVKPAAGGAPILHEGGIYHGCWLESTGTISAELLSRFLPAVAERTFLAFADGQRDDGLLPYKITADGTAFSQIQTVTPLARSVLAHYRLNGEDRGFLRRMYGAMARNDAWLVRWRDTRGTGGVEAFCCYDTGHDLSPRFWHMPDSPWNNDPTRCVPDNPLLPLVAPDLTANVACQRDYLARIADILGEGNADWRRKAEQSRGALFDCCYDDADAFFYDLDNSQQFVRVQSDVLLRVLACEIGDGAFFEEALRRYLLNTRKFFAKYPFTSIALDDPRFNPAFDLNSWAGPSNLLSLIRAPHAFEHHGRHVELAWAMQPTLSALFAADRFAQTLDPFTGREGFTQMYSPAILCLLDFVERLSGILPRPDGTLWFTGLVPQQMTHRDAVHDTAYGRTIDGVDFELVNTAADSTAFRDGDLLYQCPRSVRVVTARDGSIRGLIGMSVQGVEGVLHTPTGDYPFRAEANEELALRDGKLRSIRQPGFVPVSS